MAKAWQEVARSNEFLDLNQEDRAGARQQYFDEVVRPQLNEPDQQPAWEQFSTETANDITPYEAPEATWGERAADIGIDLAKGTVGFGQAVVGLGSLVTGGYLSDGMRALGYNPEQTNEFLSDMYSEARKGEEKRISEAEGFVGTAKEIVTQPGALVGKIAETAPMMLGSIAAARMFAAKAYAAAEAEALAAGATKAAASKVGLEASAKAATAAAATSEGAQQAGMSFDDYMAQGIDLGRAYTASIGSGITTGVTSLLGGRVGQKFGLGDVEAGIGGKGGFIARAAKGGTQEGVLEEMPQSSMEQMWNNYANERPIMEGVPEAAGTGLVVGAGAGAGFGAFQKAPAEQTDQETKPPETFSPTHNVSGGIPAERATKNGRVIQDTYVDAQGKIVRDANAVVIPIPEYDPESYDLDANAAAIEADVAAGAVTAEARQGIIESIYGPTDVLAPGAAPESLAATRQAEIERTPLEIPEVVSEPVVAEEPTAPLPVDVNEQIAQLEVQADEAGITDPAEKRQYVIEELYGRKTEAERRQDEIDRLRTGTIEEPTQTAAFAREQMAKRLPENFKDPRLGRETHRLALEGMLGDLTPGGGIAVVPDEKAIRGEGDVGAMPMKRTPSLNPAWAQAILSGENVTVKDMSAAVNSALAGEKLGARQARVVTAMLDQVTGERTAPEVVEYAVNARQEAQALRREAIQSDEGSDTAGQVFEETEYEPEWDGEARGFYELYKQAEEIDLAATEALFDEMYETDSDLQNIATELHKQVINKGEPDARKQIDERISPEEDIARPEDREKAEETEAGAASAAEIAEAVAEAEGHTASDAQINANNYKKGHIYDLQGFKLSIENEAGTQRRPEWPPLAHHYGDVTGTLGADGDPIDVFVKKDVDIAADNPIYVINQNDQETGAFDEHKVMIGFDSEADAKQGYLDSYTEDFEGFGDVVATNPVDLGLWIEAGDTQSAFPTGKKTEKERALSAKAKGVAVEKVPRATAPKPAEEPAVTPEEIAELPEPIEPAPVAEVVESAPEIIEEPVKPDEITEVIAVLDAANVTGKERLDIMASFRAGDIPIEDLRAAYPTVEPVVEEAIVEPEVVEEEIITAEDLVVAPEKTPTQTLKDALSDKYPNVGIQLSTGANNAIILDKIVVADADRNKGIGSSVMQDITDFADGAGLVIALTPSKDFGGKMMKLKKFYPRFGFVNNKGKNKDFEISESLIRQPVVTDQPMFRHEDSSQNLNIISTVDADLIKDKTLTDNQRSAITLIAEPDAITEKPALKQFTAAVVSTETPARVIKKLKKSGLTIRYYKDGDIDDRGRAVRGVQNEIYSKTDGASEERDLYDVASRAGAIDEKPRASVPVYRLKQIAEAIHNEFKGTQAISIHIRETQDRAFGRGSLERDGRIKGAFYAGSNEMVLIAENIRNEAEAAMVMRHEMVGHFGFRQLLNKEGEFDSLLDRVYAARDGELKEQYDWVAKYYPELIRDNDGRKIADEMLARTSETKTRGKFLTELYEAIINLLRKYGLWRVDPTRTGKATMDEVEQLVRLSRRNLRTKTNEARIFDRIKADPVYAMDEINGLREEDLPASLREQAGPDVSAEVEAAGEFTPESLKDQAFRRDENETFIKLTPTEIEYFSVIFDSEADLVELREAAPSVRVDENNIFYVNKADMEGLTEYIDQSVIRREKGQKNPPRFATDQFMKNLERQADEFDIADTDVMFRREDEPVGSNLGLPEEGYTDKFVRLFQDSFNRIKKLQKTIEERGGVVTPESDVYKAEERSSSIITSRLDFYKNKQKQLLAQMAENDLTLQEVDDWTTAKHAPERNEYVKDINPDNPEMWDGGSGITNAEAAATLERLSDKSNALNEAADMVYAVLKQNQRDLVEGGLITQSVVDEWNDRWSYYVPLKGKEGEEGGFGTGSGFNVVGAGIRSVMGRGAGNLAESPVVHSFAQAETGVVRAEKARVGQALVQLVRDNPDPAFWSINETTYGNFVDMYGNPFQGYEEGDLPEGLVENFDYERALVITKTERAAAKAEGRKPVPKVVMKIDPKYRQRDDVFSVMEDGKQLDIKLKDALVAEQLKRLNSNQLNAVTATFGSINRYLAMINTALNPEFVITNLERDFQTAMVNLSGEQSAKMAFDVAKSMPGAVRGIWQSTFDTKGQSEWRNIYDEMKAEGGTIGFFGLEDIETKVKNIQRKLETNDTIAGKTKRGILNVHDVVLDANLSVENAARLAAYKIARDQWIANGMPEKEAKQKAASLSKNLTVNFNRKGELAPVMNSLFLFYNASIQGSARIFTALQNKRVQKIVGGIAATAFANALYNMAAGGDDEDGIPHWDKIPDYTKQTNIIIMHPDGSGNYSKIKLPYGYNVFWYTGSAMSDMMFNPRKSAVDTALALGSAAMNAFNPIQGADMLDTITPTVLKPFEQDVRNINFMGAPIRPEYKFDAYERPDAQKVFKSTNPMLRDFIQAINEATGGDETHSGFVDFSPETLKHYTNWLTGGAGMTAARTLGTTFDIATGEEIEIKDVPFVRTLGGKPSKRFDTERFYGAIQEIEAIKAQLKIYKGTDEYGDYRDKNSETYKLIIQVPKYKKRIKSLKEKRDRAYADEDKELAREYGEDIRREMMQFSLRYEDAVEAQQ